MTPKPKFVEGEKVLCFHGPLIYEAKALKSTVTKDKQVKYYIHYAGWNKNWDEWVPENRVLKYNEANVQKQKEVFKQHSSNARKSKKGASKSKKADASGSTTKDSGASSGGSESRASTPSKESNVTLAAPTSSTTSRSNRSKQAANTSSLADTVNKKDDVKIEDSAKDDKDEPVGKKKRSGSNTSVTTTGLSTVGATGATANSNNSKNVDSCVETEEGFLSKIEVKIKIPDDLKQCLADDWDAITRQHKLLDIPAKITVQDIVDQYMAYKKAAKSTNASKELAITDVLNGIVEYFNVMLGSQLLYKFERPQYAEILQQHSETPLSKLYGAFHLLRLFIKLGPMLAFSALDEKSMQMLLQHLHDFLKFLVKNSATYFSMSNFVNVSPEYHRNTQ